MSTKTATQLSLMSLYQAGAQRGNKKSRLNPQLKGYIYSINNGICMIDLSQTITSLEHVNQFLEKIGQKRKQVLVVGTSQHLQQKVKAYAAQFGDGLTPYVDVRWLGGTVSNWQTIKKTLKRLEKLENIINNEEFFKKLSKNEQLQILKESKKVTKFFGGLKNLKTNRPGAIIILDASKNANAIKEIEGVGIPIIAITNTNIITLPQDLDKVIVSNTNSINAMDMLIEELSQSYNLGLKSAVTATTVVKEQVDSSVKLTN